RGGGSATGARLSGFYWPVIWYVLKTSVFVLFFFLLRASLPRLRYDQLMNIGWKFLIPIAMIWIPLSAAARVIEARRWIFYVIGAVVAVFILSLFVPQSSEEENHERTCRSPAHPCVPSRRHRA